MPELIALLNKVGSNLVGLGSEAFMESSGISLLPSRLILLLLLLLLLPLPLLTPPDWPRVPGYPTREDMVAWV